ncbi:MAG: rhomboid family intramembrane serine protease [Sediminimonas sp.]|uniref:rhomboid family intramembrane serine protease n=2 Tax=Sediminimonas TaxID=659427 RepID=UPI00042675D1|nr:rhomboid family intramembrane serine protease [Sediminimonas sp.]MDR9484632.1 rhomboid family intramembrane serine protease [Sediminimonas sp.]
MTNPRNALIFRHSNCHAKGGRGRFDLGSCIGKGYLPTMTASSPRDRQPPRQAPQAGAPGFLWILVGIMTAIEVILSLSQSGVFGSESLRWPAFVFGAFWQPVFSGATSPAYPGQTVLMFITYAFLHGGFMHLALNSVILLSLGKLISMQIGAARTLLVLFLAAVGGAACFGFLSSGAGPMIGASGAAFGLIGLWQAAEYRMRRQSGLAVQPVLMAILALVAANVALFAFLSGGLAWQAHLGGWIVGWLSGHSFARR